MGPTALWYCFTAKDLGKEKTRSSWKCFQIETNKLLEIELESRQ